MSPTTKRATAKRKSAAGLPAAARAKAPPRPAAARGSRSAPPSQSTSPRPKPDSAGAPSPEALIAAIGDARRRADVLELHRLIRRLAPRLAPSVGSNIIGYGRFHYRYASGHEGDTWVLGLSSRAAYISLYTCAVVEGRYVAESFKARLPGANVGKGCVRFKRLADLDRPALEALIREAAAWKPPGA